MTKTLKRIDPLQLGKISGAFYGLISLIFAPLFILFAIIASFAPKAQGSPSAPITIGIGLAMAVFLPIIYAAMGFIFGVIGAWLYNLIAKWLGGIQVQVE